MSTHNTCLLGEIRKNISTDWLYMSYIELSTGVFAVGSFLCGYLDL